MIQIDILLSNLQVWLISCTLFVFLALMEYFIVLFGIRYDKHWRKTTPRTPTSMLSNSLVTTPSTKGSAIVSSEKDV